MEDHILYYKSLTHSARKKYTKYLTARPDWPSNFLAEAYGAFFIYSTDSPDNVSTVGICFPDSFQKTKFIMEMLNND